MQWSEILAFQGLKITIYSLEIIGYIDVGNEKLVTRILKSVTNISYGPYDTGGNMECPEKNVKDDFAMLWNLHFILKYPKIGEIHLRFLFRFQNQIGKMGHFKKTRDQF